MPECIKKKKKKGSGLEIPDCPLKTTKMNKGYWIYVEERRKWH